MIVMLQANLFIVNFLLEIYQVLANFDITPINKLFFSYKNIGVTILKCRKILKSLISYLDNVVNLFSSY
jgi:hypothetical protein